ncbi:MAG: glucose-1-phosphate cytidylyltransferase [Gammaproteobacteria bacterium]|nr:MAG: glucose-1-phosphate cytidylyltransferase [Gammaproteobacteria bacterium]
MKAVILAGGFGTRISEESSIKPKPMVEIGGKPIIWHIMKIYSAYGINDFIICCGYKSQVLKQYFLGYHTQCADITFDLENNRMEVHNSTAESWRVTLVETGDDSMTGGRLRQVRKYIGDETFCFTYGDGVSDVHVGKLIEFHKAQGTLATVTAFHPPGRFGAFQLGHNDNRVPSFKEKPHDGGAWVNSGFFVLEPGVMDYIEGDSTSWEKEPMERLAVSGELSAFRHNGFWQPMDTLNDKHMLEDMWQSGNPPWKVW